MEIVVDQSRKRAFEQSIKAMADFKAAFGRGLSGDFVAELYAANALGLRIVELNQSGYDALSASNERYQVKFRSVQTLNVDINNFDFDYLVLVNLDEDYQLIGMWRITAAQAREIFIERAKFHKYQATQNKVKSAGEFIAPQQNETDRDNEVLFMVPAKAGRRWREIRGAAAHLAAEGDAQEWVSKSRRQDDAQSGVTQ